MDLKSALFNKFGDQVAVKEDPHGNMLLDGETTYQDPDECVFEATCLDGKRRVFKVILVDGEPVFSSKEDLFY